MKKIDAGRGSQKVLRRREPRDIGSAGALGEKSDEHTKHVQTYSAIPSAFLPSF